jgi:hypothetical protein
VTIHGMRAKGTGTIANRRGRWWAMAPRMKGQRDRYIGNGFEQFKQAEKALADWLKENKP